MQNICRTCLTTITEASYSINETLCINDSQQELISVEKMLKDCIPELAIDMVQESVICNTCLTILSSSYKFRTKCLKNEKKLQEFVSSSTKNLNFAKILVDKESTENTYSKTHSCSICNKTFLSEVFLKKHMKSHENQAKYECGVCGKIFTEAVKLKIHILTHNDNEAEPNYEEEVDYDESVSSKVAPFMVATTQNLESTGNFEVVTVLGNKYEPYKIDNRKIWTDEETLQFLDLCKHHVKDMHQGQKKSLWSLISKKLSTKNILVSPEQCESKWKNLIRTYNQVKMKLLRDPLAYTKFQYLNEFEELMIMLKKVRGSGNQSILKSLLDFHDNNDEKVIIMGYDKEEDNVKNKSTSIEQKFWTNEETLALLDSIRQKKTEFEGGESAPGFWDAVTDDITQYNYDVSAEQCETKWKTLKRTYKRVKEKLSNSNFASTNFAYFHLVDDILQDETGLVVLKRDYDSLHKLLENSVDSDTIEIQTSKKMKFLDRGENSD